MSKPGRKPGGVNVPVYVFLWFVALLTSVPLYYMFANAFKDPKEIMRNPVAFPVSTFTFANLTRSWESLKYPDAFKNSVILLLLSVLIMVVAGSLAGFAIALVRSKLLNGLYVASLLVISIPFQVVMIPLVIMLKNVHLLNNYLGTSLVNAAISLPIVIFMYTGFMRSLPRELCEAAIVDGCGMFKTYSLIYMPLLKTVTGTVLIVRGTSVWNDLLVPLVTLQKQSMTPIILRLYTFASLMFNSWDLIFGSALLCSLPVILLFLFMQRFFLQGIVMGAVKG